MEERVRGEVDSGGSDELEGGEGEKFKLNEIWS